MNRERKRKIDTKYRKGKREYLYTTFGNKCHFCGYKDRLVVHRKDGLKHPKISAMSKKQINRIKEDKDEYIVLCFRCHKSVHWVMNNLKLSWEDMVSLHTR